MRITISLPALAGLAVLSLPDPARAAEGDVTAAAPSPVDGESGAINGLYPLWEQTALLHKPGAFQIGYNHAQVGLGRVQLGTEPILDLHGALNLQAKVALWQGDRLKVALVLGGYRLPTAAESRTVGNLYPTGFSNYAPVWLVPICLAKSVRLVDRLALHWASTLLLSTSSAPEHRYVAGGQTLLLDLAATPQWHVRLHGGAEGWPVQTVAHAGLSFGYVGRYVYASLGAGRRFPLDGEPANQVLLDGGLLFP
jgi:hypothetical protein